GDAPQQEPIGIFGMAVMVDGGAIDPDECPAARVQASGQLQFLGTVKIAVCQVTDRLDGGASVEPATVESRHPPGRTIRIISLVPLFKFAILYFAIDDVSAHARNSRLFPEHIDCGLKEALVQLHIAVHQQQVAPAAVLESKLCT